MSPMQLGLLLALASATRGLALRDLTSGTAKLFLAVRDSVDLGGRGKIGARARSASLDLARGSEGANGTAATRRSSAGAYASDRRRTAVPASRRRTAPASAAGPLVLSLGYDTTEYHSKRPGLGYAEDPLVKEQRINKFLVDDKKKEDHSHLLFLTVIGLSLGMGVLFCAGCVPQVRTPPKRSGLAGSPAQPAGLYDRLFLKHRNKAFGEDFELAARGAFFACLVSIPFAMPRGLVPAVDAAVDGGMYGSTAVVYFVFTVYKTAGETVYFARCAILGTLIAVVNCTCMYLLFPVGVSKESIGLHMFDHGLVVYYGWAHGIVYVGLTFLLRLEHLTVVFGLYSFVWFWMGFLTPGKDYGISGFAWVGAALLESVLGCGFAILALLLPRPVWAIDKARGNAMCSVALIGRTWRTFVEDVCSGTWSATKQETILDTLANLHKEIAAMGTHVDNAWYECFGLGRRQRAREMMQGLGKSERDGHDMLLGTIGALGTARRSEMLAQGELKTNAKKLVADANEVRRICASFACDGVLTPRGVDDIRAASDRVRQSIKSLTYHFETAKASAGGLSDQHLNEHIFCFALCSFGRSSVNFADQLVATRDSAPSLKSAVDLSNLQSAFDKKKITSADNVSNAAKHTLMMILGFAVGYHGYMQLFPMYNAGVAGVMALLISDYAGSAIVKNMARIQGVVFGLILGMILHEIFGHCYWWGNLGVAISLVAIMYLGLFLYFNSTTSYSTFGCLFAVFAATPLLQPCMEHVLDFHPRRQYANIVVTVVAIALMVAIDLLFARTRASDEAYLTLAKSLRSIRAATQHLFDPNQTSSWKRRDEVLQAIGEAEAMAGEADQEPRYWRAPFQTELFLKALSTLKRMHFSMSMAEISTSDKGLAGAPKTPALMELLAKPSFQGVPQLLLDKMAILERLLAVFVHETPDRTDLMDAESQRDFVTEWTTALQQFLSEVSRDKLFKCSGDELETVEEDPLAQLSVIFASTTATMAEVSKLRYTILKAAA